MSEIACKQLKKVIFNTKKRGNNCRNEILQIYKNPFYKYNIDFVNVSKNAKIIDLGNVVKNCRFFNEPLFFIKSAHCGTKTINFGPKNRSCNAVITILEKQKLFE